MSDDIFRPFPSVWNKCFILWLIRRSEKATVDFQIASTENKRKKKALYERLKYCIVISNVLNICFDIKNTSSTAKKNYLSFI